MKNEDFKKITDSMQEKIGKEKASVIADNFATIINSIKGLSDIWNDEDLTYGEKVLTTFTTLGTVIGTLVSTYSNFNKAKLMGIKNDILALAIQ